MRVAEVADVVVAVPPPKYGGIEYVISVVTEGLVARGHDVTLFATGDSHTQAKLVPSTPKAIGFQQPNYDAWITRIRQLAHVADQSGQFDIIHNHLGETFAFLDWLKAPLVTTLHGSVSDPVTRQVMAMPEVQQTYFISVSEAQRRAMSHLPIVRTIYHGLDVSQYPFAEEAGEYLLLVGRIAPEKGIETAVEVARLTGRRLVVAAKIDQPPGSYAKRIVKLFARSPHVHFFGEADAAQKKKLYAEAYAFLMPIAAEEPFGLVVIESLACGTPVIAFRRGSMPELIEEGKTGFIVRQLKEMTAAVEKIPSISRAACRQSVVTRFTIDTMVQQYEQTFREIIAEWGKGTSHPAGTR